jgi:hypothetical protein
MSYCLLFCDVIKNSEGNTVTWKVYTLGAFILEYGGGVVVYHVWGMKFPCVVQVI